MELTEKLAYRDTRNYTAIDAVKGISLITHEIVMGDAPAPEGSTKMPKCKFCRHFTASLDANLGVCQASPHSFFAYHDMIAVTCENYQEI